MRAWFNVRKAAQVSAFFAMQDGGTINVLKLVKLVYLSNRLAMERFDFPLLDDNLVSMEHGPVNSLTFDCINGFYDQKDPWDEFITARARHIVGLADPGLKVAALDELSRADLAILTEIWKNFGHLNQWDLRTYTHDHCPEWEDPNGSSFPIPYERVFKFLKKADSDFLAQRIFEKRGIDEAFSRKI